MRHPSSFSEHRVPTRTKILATIGPASESPEIVRDLIHAGVNVFRFNFSHGDLSDHERRLRTVRAVADELGQPVAVMGDLQGPKIRVGNVPDGGIMLEPGQDVVFRAEPVAAFADGGRVVLATAYPNLVEEVEPGHRVLVNDGAIRMLAVESIAGGLCCRVIVGGLVTSHKGINLPDSEVSAPAITDRDWGCVEWAVAHDLDFLALSFVSQPEEVLELKERVSGMCPADRVMKADEGSRIPVVAKIERPQAMARIERIVEATDLVMVARGDLGVEMDIARVPVAQKKIMATASSWGRPCIVATQMLESMIESATPTRAEASDVAGAVFDGADAVMLSGETAVGRHPVLVVETMSRIIASAEAHLTDGPSVSQSPQRLVESHHPIAALAHGVWQVAMNSGAVLVACWSEHGGAARHLSRNAFRIPIIAWSSDARSTRRMTLLSGVTPVHAPRPGSRREWVKKVEEALVERGWARPGDPIVLVAGYEPGAGVTNAAALHRVGQGGGFGPS